MITAGVLALLVVTPSLLVHLVLRLLRGWREDRVEFPVAPTSVPTTAPPAEPTSADVAILIVARDREDRVVGAIEAASRVVPEANVFLVSNGSSDRTAELANELGAQVVETLGSLTATGAAGAGLQAFRLLERFPYVLMTDVDTRVAPDHLRHALPLFADPAVAAVDARVAPDWLPPRRVLAAYRARRHVLTQTFGRGRTGPPASLTRALPSVARIYRSTALDELVLDPPGVVSPDLDATLQLYGKKLGRVALSPGPAAVSATSLRLRDHRELTDRDTTGLWQAVRRQHPHGPALAAQLVELLVASLVVALVPVAAVLLALPDLVPAFAEWSPLAAARSVVGPLELVLGLVLADLLLTAGAAIATRQPRYLLTGPLFPLLRVVDAVDVLHASVNGRLGRAEVAEPVAPTGSWRRLSAGAVAGWALLVAAATATVVRVATVTDTLPAAPGEVALTEANYGRFADVAVADVPNQLAMTDRQLAIFTDLTAPFERHANVLTGARELSVSAVVVLLIGLLLLTAALRVPPLLTAVVVAVLAAAGPAVAVLGQVGPGVVAAGWLALGAACVLFLRRAVAQRRHVLAGLTGLLAPAALLAALVTAPLLVVPVGIGVAVWLWSLDIERYDPDTTWRGHAALVLLATAGIAALLWREELLLVPSGGGPLDADQRLALLAAVTGAAVAGLVVTRARPVAAAILTGVVIAGWFDGDADVLVPALVAAATFTAALVLAAMANRRAALAGAFTVTFASIAALVGVLLVPPAAPPAEHAALAAWVTNQLGDGLTVTAPAGMWADLHRDLAGSGRNTTVRRAQDGPADGIVVASGPDQPTGIVLGRFGSLTLLTTDLDETYLDPAPRVIAGQRLADNSRLTTTKQASAALRAGQVDLRAMAVLAGLCAEYDLTLTATGNPVAERDSALPDRTLVLSTLDGRSLTGEAVAGPLMAWLAAQQPPYAPATSRRTPEGVAISWRLPPASLDGATG